MHKKMFSGEAKEEILKNLIITNENDIECSSDRKLTKEIYCLINKGDNDAVKTISSNISNCIEKYSLYSGGDQIDGNESGLENMENVQFKKIFNDNLIRKNVFCILYLFLKFDIRGQGVHYVEYFDQLLKMSIDNIRKIDKYDSFFISEFFKQKLNSINEMNVDIHHKSITFLVISLMCNTKKPNTNLIVLGTEVLVEILKISASEESLNELYKDILVLANYKIHHLRLREYLMVSIFNAVCIHNQDYATFRKCFYTRFLEETNLDFKNEFEDIFIGIVEHCNENKLCKSFTVDFCNFYLTNIMDLSYESGFKVFCKGLNALINDSKQDTIEVEEKLIKKGIFHIISILAERKLPILGEKNKKSTTTTKMKKDRSLTSNTYLHRNYAAKAILKIDFNIISFGFHTRKKIINLVRPCLKEKTNILKASAHILCSIKPKVVLAELSKKISIEKRRILFDMLKYKNSDEVIFTTYFELLSSKFADEIEYNIKNLNQLFRVFITFHNKSVCRYINVDLNAISDLYAADFALHYSEFHPDRLDPVYICSLLVDNDDLLKPEKIAYYIRIVQIISNIYIRLSLPLKKRLIAKLKTLMFYGPYTKHVGYLIYKLGFNKFQITGSNLYNLVIMASCNHPGFKNVFSDTEWSEYKEKALVYYLRYHPEYGMMFKWKINEIVERIYLCQEEKDCMLILEIFKFLCDAFKQDFINNNADSCFYFNYVNEIQDKVIYGVKIKYKSIKLQSVNLLKQATINKSILPDVSIPILLSYHKIDTSLIQIFENTVLNCINIVIDNKVEEFKKTRDLSDKYFLYQIYSIVENKDGLCERIVISSDIFRTYIVVINNMYMKRKGVLNEKIKQSLFSVLDEDNEVYRFILDSVSEGKKEYSKALADENVLFNE